MWRRCVCCSPMPRPRRAICARAAARFRRRLSNWVPSRRWSRGAKRSIRRSRRPRRVRRRRAPRRRRARGGLRRLLSRARVRPTISRAAPSCSRRMPIALTTRRTTRARCARRTPRSRCGPTCCVCVCSPSTRPWRKVRTRRRGNWRRTPHRASATTPSCARGVRRSARVSHRSLRRPRRTRSNGAISPMPRPRRAPPSPMRRTGSATG